MSRAYDMYLQVAGFQIDSLDAIKAAAHDLWDFEWFYDTQSLLEGFGESSLCVGESEESFAERLTKAIWAANGGFCSVIVTATYLENLPHETYAFDEVAFERLRAAGPGDIK
jgi:hypothetical protein